ncbi:MAG: GNAT family protein [bacterium]
MLRAWSTEDAPSLRATLVSSDAHLRAWTPWVVDGRVPGLSLDSRLQQHADAFATGTEWVYGMFSLDEREVLGGCGLYPRVGPGAMEIGYWLSVAHTGRGLATEATELLAHLAFTSPEIERVLIRCDPRNEASARIPARLGYHVDGADQRDTAPSAHSLSDVVTWVMTRTEFALKYPRASTAYLESLE